MDREIMERLERLLCADDIYRAYADSVRELEACYAQIADSLPPDQRQVLTGYRECMKLMELRARTLACEKMVFAE